MKQFLSIKTVADMFPRVAMKYARGRVSSALLAGLLGLSALAIYLTGLFLQR
ncbi:MAG: hypothetical protein V4623_08120 [Pseudomonadota bacterium]